MTLLTFPVAPPAGQSDLFIYSVKYISTIYWMDFAQTFMVEWMNPDDFLSSAIVRSKC